MDKRYKPLTPAEQLELREKILATLAEHPEWTVPEVVRYVRTTLRLTTAEMARVGKLSVLTLKNLEAGRSSPTLDTVTRLLRPFGLRVSVTSSSERAR
jgi:DNA-binding transcriptional regulator YiaG